MKGMNVTSLEKRALANLKGGAKKVEAPVWCPNNIGCAGAGQSIVDQLEIQNKK